MSEVPLTGGREPLQGLPPPSSSRMPSASFYLEGQSLWDKAGVGVTKSDERFGRVRRGQHSRVFEKRWGGGLLSTEEMAAT